jgi:hypothetical protein
MSVCKLKKYGALRNFFEVYKKIDIDAQINKPAPVF